MRRLFLLALSAVGLSAGIVLGANLWVIASGGRLAHQPEDVRPVDVALLLGTSSYSVEGHTNRHFEGRIDAAVRLYRAGVVRHILASGANPEVYYNEPQRMREALVARGVPASAITLDYAGRRTLDSVVRAQHVFGLESFVIISQPYHLHRAIYLARAEGLDVQGFAAAGPPLEDRWLVELREILARLLALIDVHVLHTKPQLLGDPEPITL